MDRKHIDILKLLLNKHSKDLDFIEVHSEIFSQKVLDDFKIMLSVYGTVMSPEDETKYFDLSLNEFLHENPITVNLSQSLVKKRKHWLTEERKVKAGWVNDSNPLASYRTRYLEYLRKIGRADKVVDEVALSSLSILEKIEDPLVHHPFQKKGLVVGSVQSGKTGNFNAVINSSIDLGYRLILVLSGGMEDLRKQTQERIQKEVEGREIKQGVWNGVGNIAKFGTQHINKEQIIIPTSFEKDFNLGLTNADFALDKINVLVCKKNTSILKNILIWLKRFATKEVIDNIPLLIIDDEADNASLNNLGHKGKEEATKINLQIRCILSLFSKSSYIGYTATPFANILQDRNSKPENSYKIIDRGEEYNFSPIGNLFPEDFIELLSPPSNYVGPKNFFETKISEIKKIPSLITVINDWYNEFPYRVRKDDPDIPYTKTVEELSVELGSDMLARKEIRIDSRAATKYDNFPKDLPESLKDAVKCFIISCAVRLKRKPSMKDSVLFQKHNSMLIHISRFTFWQNKTTELLETYFDKLKKALNNDPVNSTVYNDLRRVWNKYYIESIEQGIVKDYLPEGYTDEFMTPVNFDGVLNHLIAAVNGIEIVCANSESKFTLDYSNEAKQYIVVGGNRLSRGFTLEGLTVNYFVRDTNYADSLLQMGRWFGYRPGYLDCCKLFTTSDTIESFDFSTGVVEDIEAQFSKMSSKDRTPAEFAIKVMNDPDVIKITRPSILKNAQTIRWSYSDKLDQTTKFQIDKIRIENAWSNFLDYFKAKNYLNFGKQDKPTIKYFDSDVEEICSILSMSNSFANPNHYNPLISFIKDVNKEKGYLSKWSVGIKITGNGQRQFVEELLGFNIDPAVRNIKQSKIDDTINKNTFIASGDSSNIITAGSDFAFAITEELRLAAEEKFRNDNEDRKTYPEKIYRNSLDKTHGVLIIYPIDIKTLVEKKELENYFLSKGITENTPPFLGFAVGIPDLGDDFEKDYFVQKGFLDEHGNIIKDFVVDESSEDTEDTGTDDAQFDDEYTEMIHE
ncbi:Z1 domain-containing protein [Chryseobacterium oranimense]|uniref:Z1 domain-containing protein n=1 Tax=Chryseobacterium oranimense TaxID=421058 RepID=A0A1M5X684_9FLAO|nr:Z1 domain-containing protein [Chryseobacterium oranimense]SHH94723.1 Z1 domain-containing protein [Chryseobacterium oranimense]